MKTSTFSCIFSIIVGLNSFAVISQEIPAAITPGGAEPELNQGLSLPAIQEEIFPIPPVIERPLDVDSGPKISVKDINLVGFSDYVENDIFFDELKQIVDEEVANHQNNQEAAQLTIGQLQVIADKLTLYYRSHGLVLAQVYIPVQEVKNNIVEFNVLEGKLGKVFANDNNHYTDEQILKPFSKLLNKPVSAKEMEEALLLLNDYPGLTVGGMFTTGQQVGTADLKAMTLEEKWYSGRLLFDSSGSKYTGKDRYLTELNFYNLAGLVDTLSLQLLQTDRPSNSVYWSFRYELQAFNPRNYVGISSSQNKFDVGSELQALGLEGYSTQHEVYWRHVFKRSRNLNIYGRLGLALKESETKTKTDFTLGTDKLTVLTAQLSFDHVDKKYAGINLGSISYSQGFDGLLGAMEDKSLSSDGDHSSRRKSNGDYVGGKFSKWNLELARVQALNEDQTLTFNFKGQYTKDSLVSLEQYSMGGPNSVRAYPASEFLVDKGYFASLEWNVGFPFIGDNETYNGKRWKDMINFSVFVDHAEGWLNDPLDNEEEKKSLSGVGVGMYFTDINGLDGRFYVAKPFSSHEASNDRDYQVFFEVSYKF
ncbi:ShlB/FhaC/HecB family hemolysin secretion/activation protein [Zooshikella ganghwensis]|uniref:ShlB/FhaC/HecB family hemolysin secretion/activation protein n=1 Tax=Zooshikella ganghwensis TaxID=202772 RepID=UPI0004064AFF|nr:ShlB/FhaC/HecB family hemolysin secretion/activation protein [Zooshikella ganghwensis]